MKDEWAHQPALALGAAIENGRADPRDITDYFLDRITDEDNDQAIYVRVTAERAKREAAEAAARAKAGLRRSPLDGDRKSTRLNSSHDQNSYAVFCLKKKTPLTLIILTLSHLTTHKAIVCCREISTYTLMTPLK